MRDYVDDDAHQAGSFDEEDDAGEGPAAFVRRIEEELAARLADPFDRSDRGAAVAQAFEDLPDGQRRVVVLRLSGYSAKEVAEQLDLTPVNVDKIHSRGIKQLRAALKDLR